MVDSSQMTATRLVSKSLKLIQVSNQQKNTNIQIAYYFRVFMLVEYVVYLYAIILSRHQKVASFTMHLFEFFWILLQQFLKLAGN